MWQLSQQPCQRVTKFNYVADSCWMRVNRIQQLGRTVDASYVYDHEIRHLSIYADYYRPTSIVWGSAVVLWASCTVPELVAMHVGIVAENRITPSASISLVVKLLTVMRSTSSWPIDSDVEWQRYVCDVFFYFFIALCRPTFHTPFLVWDVMITRLKLINDALQ